MGPVIETRTPPLPPLPPVPRLQSGDRLTGVEFERRLAAMGDGVDAAAELIDGVVYMVPPVGMAHGSPHIRLCTWLGVYESGTPGVRAADNATLRLDEADRVQPDALLSIVPEAGGRVRYDSDGILRGSVELVVEVAASSAAYDLHQKKAAYARHGIPEYVVYVVHSNELHWFFFEDGDYAPGKPDERGVLRSRVFPGLWLDAAAFLRADMAAVLETVRLGIASKEHEGFVAELGTRLARA